MDNTHSEPISFFRRIRLRTRLIVTVCAVSILPLLLLTTLSFCVFRSSIQTKLIQSTVQSAQLASNNINLFLNNYRHYIDTVSVSEAVQNVWALRYEDTSAEKYDVISGMTRLTRNTFIAESGYIGVILIDRDKHVIYNSAYCNVNESDLYTLLEECDAASPKDRIEKLVDTTNRTEYITMARKVYSSNLRGTHVGYIAVLISTDHLHSTAFASPAIHEDAGFMLISPNGNVLVSQNPASFPSENIDKPLLETLIERSSAADTHVSTAVENAYLYICYNNNVFDSYVLSIIPYSFISNEQQRVFFIILLALIPLMALCIIVSSLLNTSLNVPIQRIIDSCKTDINSPDYHSINDSSPDELGFLSRTLDKKNENIIELIENIKEKDASKRTLELEMLRYQINPHFLFNTLSTFKWMAELSNNAHLSDGIGSLIGLLKSTLVANAEFVTVQNEIENLKHYNCIQDLRYISRFQTRFEIDDAAQQCMIPHFILQPLLENAIIHAADLDRVISITIRASVRTDILEIVIADDGVGFDTRSAYDTDQKRFTGIGLRNVDERLKLYYGQDNGLIIHSAPARGTICIVRIPLNQESNESR